ncbi:hypothetical protein U1Q18_032198 [Sarracenia purpurea var. burkii]
MIDESLDDKLKEDDEFVDDYLESSLAFSGNTYCNLYSDGWFALIALQVQCFALVLLAADCIASLFAASLVMVRTMLLHWVLCCWYACCSFHDFWYAQACIAGFASYWVCYVSHCAAAVGSCATGMLFASMLLLMALLASSVAEQRKSLRSRADTRWSLGSMLDPWSIPDMAITGMTHGSLICVGSLVFIRSVAYGGGRNSSTKMSFSINFSTSPEPLSRSDLGICGAFLPHKRNHTKRHYGRRNSDARGCRSLAEPGGGRREPRSSPRCPPTPSLPRSLNRSTLLWSTVTPSSSQPISQMISPFKSSLSFLKSSPQKLVSIYNP